MYEAILEVLKRERDILATELSEYACPQVEYDFCPMEGKTCDPRAKGACWGMWAEKVVRAIK